MVMITLQITEEDLRVLYNAAGDGLSAMFDCRIFIDTEAFDDVHGDCLAVTASRTFTL